MAEDDDKKPTEGDMLRLAIYEAVAACPGLLFYGGNPEQPETGPVGQAVMEAIRRSTKKVQEMRARIDEASGISMETAIRYMATAAAAHVLSELPPGSDERKLYDAGIAVGKYITRKWQQRIEGELSKKQGGN